MRTVTVSASKTYDVHIGSGILNSIAEQILRLGKVRKVCVVSESTVFPLYGEAVVGNLESAGLEVVRFLFPAGEES